MQTATKIAFIDRDHVLKLAEIALLGADPAGLEHIRKLFAPEPVDWAKLSRVAEGLRAQDSVSIILPGQDPSEADIVVLRRGLIDRSFIEACPRLKLIQQFGKRGAGVDLEAARQHHVFVAGCIRPSIQYTAEHALLLMLALGKRLLPSDRAVRAGTFDRERVEILGGTALRWAGIPNAHGLYGRTLGLIGFGEVASIVSELAQAFGMRVVYTKRKRFEPEVERSFSIQFLPFRDLLRDADMVSLHASNLPENERMIGRAEFEYMRSTALFINTSRGRLVDEDALYDALAENRIAGAGLDVHASEPRQPRDRFAGLDNVVLTPHMAAGSEPPFIEEVEAMFDNCRDVLAGRPPARVRLA
jgi:lactate dehydrogenase-like 2-hydroxyacid dehydrogenase